MRLGLQAGGWAILRSLDGPNNNLMRRSLSLAPAAGGGASLSRSVATRLALLLLLAVQTPLLRCHVDCLITFSVRFSPTPDSAPTVTRTV